MLGPTRCDEAALDAIAQHFRLLRGLCVFDSTRSIAASRSSIICKDNAPLRKRSLSASMSIVSASCKSCSKRLGSHFILFVRLCSLDTQLEDVHNLWRLVELLALAVQL